MEDEGPDPYERLRGKHKPKAITASAAMTLHAAFHGDECRIEGYERGKASASLKRTVSTVRANLK